MGRSPTLSTPPPDGLVGAALAGDEHAFSQLVAPYRGELHVHAYRMLGSVHDADDALQDALLRAWRSLASFDRTRSVRPWLYKITTNVCLDMIGRRRARGLPFDHSPSSDPGLGQGEALPGSTWIEPYPDDRLPADDRQASPEASYDRREAIELAFISALQHLPGRQRAVLILREVLGFSAREVADATGATVPAVNSALQRARSTLDARLPRRSQQATVRALGDAAVRDLVERFAAALEAGDVDGILALLTDDVMFATPPYAAWCEGRSDVARSWLMPSDDGARLRYVATSANGQPALAVYRREPGDDTYVQLALDVLSVDGGLVGSVVAFRAPEVFAVFGLPPTLD
jgi:RNA polymerase sigma-70 factor (ECF subfamily)